jgi:hypothetical protein
MLRKTSQLLQELKQKEEDGSRKPTKMGNPIPLKTQLSARILGQ